MSTGSKNDELESVMRELEETREKIALGDGAASRQAEEAIAHYDRASRRSRVGWLLPLAALLAAGFIYLRWQSGEQASEPARPEHNRWNAWGMAQQFVEPKLVAPADARFSCDRGAAAECVEKLGDVRYRVRGVVDAPNRLGVKIRARFDVTVEYAGESKWRLIGDVELKEQ
jgi:hypothetical protein